MMRILTSLVIGSFFLTGCTSLKKEKTLFPQPASIESYDSGPAVQRLPDSHALRPTGHAQATSLWSSSPQSLFGDRRASQQGDILTVMIEIDEEAEFNNSLSQDRQNSENFGIGALFGLPEKILPQLPDGASLTPAVDISRAQQSAGNGQIKRGEKITLSLAAQVINVLPNGYLQLAGQQQIRVNQEVRELQMTGIVRPEDISRLNVVTYDKIANARIYYGGQGNISRTVKENSGSKILSKIIPF